MIKSKIRIRNKAARVRKAGVIEHNLLNGKPLNERTYGGLLLQKL